MADTVSKAQRSRIMAKVRSKDTKPEIQVRRAVHAAGFRFRLHLKQLPGKPDVVFPRYKVAVFVNGCLWHWHGCWNSRMPSTNVDYWNAKIKRNTERDEENIAALQAAGWAVITVWECELNVGIEAVIATLKARRG